MAPVPGDAMKSRFELFTEFVRAIAWPVLVAGLVIAFWPPLKQTAAEIPVILNRSDTVTIAGIALKVGPLLYDQATPEVRRALAKASNDGVTQILRLADSQWYHAEEEKDGRAYMKEMITLGLVAVVPAADLAKTNQREHEHYTYAIRSTERGQKTRAYLESVIAEFVHEMPIERTERAVIVQATTSSN